MLSSDPSQSSNFVNKQEIVSRIFSQTDIKIPLNDKITSNYAQSNVKLQLKTKFNLPNYLLQEIKQAESKIEFGLFDGLNRVFGCIDYKFYLWNYEDDEDTFSFEGMKNTILVCSLLTPRPTYFESKIRNLIALVTVDEIKCLALSVEGNDVTVYLSEIGCSTDGILMMDLCSLPSTGQIFMAGRDGCLYELEYEAEEGWFKRKCNLKNLSRSTLTLLLPSFISSAASALMKVAVDRSRGILYTLSDDSELTIYELRSNNANDLRDLRYKPVFLYKRNLISDMKKFYSLYARHFQDSFADGVKMSNLFTQSVDYYAHKSSNDIALVVVTNRGHRLYFTFVHSTLTLAHVRTLSNESVLPVTLFDCSYYKEGVFIVGGTAADGRNVMCYTLPHLGQMKSRNLFSEFIGVELSQEQKVWAVAEVTNCEDDSALFNDYKLQLQNVTRKFLVLSNNGVSVFTKLSVPKIISSSLHNIEKRILDLIPSDDLLCCLLCIITDPHSSSQSKSAANGQFAKIVSNNPELLFTSFVLFLSRTLESLIRNPICTLNCTTQKYPELLSRLDFFLIKSSLTNELFTSVVKTVRDGLAFLILILTTNPELLVDVNYSLFELIFMPHGKEMIKDLAKRFIDYVLDSNSKTSIDSICTQLGKECGEFFSSNDLKIYKAKDCLKNNNKKESLRLYLEAAQDLTFDQVEKIADIYAGLDFYEGIASLILECVSRSGSNLNVKNSYCQLLLIFVDRIVNTNEANMSSLFSESEFFKAIYAAKNEQFMFLLFTYLYDKSKLQTMLKVQPPYLLEYLLEKQYDEAAFGLYLCTLYRNRKQYEEALNKLYELATNEKYPANLEKRIELMIMFLSIYKSCKVHGNEETVKEVDDLLDVANIQWEMLKKLKESDEKYRIALNTKLLDITQLYEIAKETRMHESKLAIFHISDYNENPQLILEAWNDLIEEYMYQPIELYQAIVDASHKYAGTHVFPLKELLIIVDSKSFETQADIMGAFLEKFTPLELFKNYDSILEERIFPFDSIGGMVWVFENRILKLVEKCKDNEYILSRLLYWKNVLQSRKRVEIGANDYEDLEGVIFKINDFEKMNFVK